MRTRLIESESVAQGRAFGSHEGAQSRPTWARVERLVRPSGRAFLGDHRTALGGRGRAFRIGRDRGPVQAPFYGPPGARKRPQRPGRCVDHGPHRRFDPNRSSASLEADCLLAQQTGGLVDDAGFGFNLDLRQAKVGDIISPTWLSILQWSADAGASRPQTSQPGRGTTLLARSSIFGRVGK